MSEATRRLTAARVSRKPRGVSDSKSDTEQPKPWIAPSICLQLTHGDIFEELIVVFTIDYTC
jgi:hypothetical protein